MRHRLFDDERIKITRACIADALLRNNLHRTAAAKTLKISRRSLITWIRELDLRYKSYVQLAQLAETCTEQDPRAAYGAFEREKLIEALRANGGFQTKTAAALGIGRRSLIYKLKQYKITREMAWASEDTLPSN